MARTLFDRAKNIPSTDDDKKSEVQHVVDVLKPNGYTDQFLKSCRRTKLPKALNQPQNNQPQSHRGFVTLPYTYFQGISEKIARTLGEFDVNVAHKPVKTIGSILKKPKDKFDYDLSTSVVYKINCKNCKKRYIGQTSRTLRSRTKEHKRAALTCDKNSLLARHCMKNNHEFDFNNVKVIDHCPLWSRRLFLEAWHSIREPNSINDHAHIPDI